jgi:hypothetical protein
MECNDEKTVSVMIQANPAKKEFYSCAEQP